MLNREFTWWASPCKREFCCHCWQKLNREKEDWIELAVENLSVVDLSVVVHFYIQLKDRYNKEKERKFDSFVKWRIWRLRHHSTCNYRTGAYEYTSIDVCLWSLKSAFVSVSARLMLGDWNLLTNVVISIMC